jgi:hypothetical protein
LVKEAKGGIVMENYDSELKRKKPVGYLVNMNIRTSIPIYEHFGLFRTLMWWALGFRYYRN